MNNIYGIAFNSDSKVYYFKTHDLVCPINVTVIVETEKGLQFGKVVSEIAKDKIGDNLDNIKSIIRIATKEDYSRYLKNLKDAKEAIAFANEIITKLKLTMHILDSSYTFDRKQLLFNFTADERVDFRELAKELAGKYRTRIELRQVGARDKAKKIGGVGICGHELCCKRFLNKIQSVTMNMAKDQNIALNPSKINGCCGRLLCCLQYEDEEYQNCLNGMPDVGTTIKTSFGTGQVISLNILERKYKVNIDNDIKEIELDNYENSKK
jgi:cell fate regulator YaaT (PSP1 superfamily)